MCLGSIGIRLINYTADVNPRSNFGSRPKLGRPFQGRAGPGSPLAAGRRPPKAAPMLGLLLVTLTLGADILEPAIFQYILNGTISNTICKANFTTIGVPNSNLSGTIPHCINTSVTKTFFAPGNKFTGDLPRDFAYLQVLDVTGSNLTGIVPNMPIASYVNLLGNEFSGCFPRLPRVNVSCNIGSQHFTCSHRFCDYSHEDFLSPLCLTQNAICLGCNNVSFAEPCIVDQKCNCSCHCQGYFRHALRSCACGCRSFKDEICQVEHIEDHWYVYSSDDIQSGTERQLAVLGMGTLISLMLRAAD